MQAGRRRGARRALSPLEESSRKYEGRAEAATEADEAYMSARAGAMANRQRNMGGSTNILTWQ